MPSFAELSNEFLDAEFADSPVRASGLGLTEYDEQLDDLSEAAFDRRSSADCDWLERFRGSRRSEPDLRRGDRPRPRRSASCAAARSSMTSRSGAASRTSISTPA